MGGEGDGNPNPWDEGVRLFNERRFFECHEVWERLWKRSSGVEKLFYHGMIQTAAALLHAQRGELRGAQSTWLKARVKLDSLPPDHHGIALRELCAAVDELIASVRPGVPPERMPAIVIATPRLRKG